MKGNSLDLPRPTLLSLPSPPTLKHAKEPVVPRAVVPQVLRQQSLRVPQLALPHTRVLRLVTREELAEDPLAVSPRVVVLRVETERAGGEGELAGRVVEREDDGAAVLPEEQWGLVGVDGREEGGRGRTRLGSS